jgi:ABC-2 type transport system permease protein
MASYAMWAILGVAFFQFGVGIAEERATPWERFLRTLPLSAGQRLGGRVLSAGLFAAAAAAVVIAEAHLINPVSVAADRWLPWLGALGVGGVVVALGGIAMGYWVSPRAATPVATMAWLLLAYLGGLWATPTELPGWAAEVSPYLPTRLWGETTWAALQGEATSARDWLGLLAYAVGFTVLARWGYRRDEAASYR